MDEYGGFAIDGDNDPYKYADGWAKLFRILELLKEAKDPLPPYLAQWLGSAIEYSDKDAQKFIQRLGIGFTKGRPNSFHDEAWLFYGSQVAELRADGVAWKNIPDKLKLLPNEKAPSMSMLHNYLKTYNQALEQDFTK